MIFRYLGRNLLRVRDDDETNGPLLLANGKCAQPENGQEIDGPGDGHLFDALVEQVLEPNPGRIVGRVRPAENDAVNDVADAMTQARHQIHAGATGR